jgi:hypothetical protein
MPFLLISVPFSDGETLGAYNQRLESIQQCCFHQAYILVQNSHPEDDTGHHHEKLISALHAWILLQTLNSSKTPLMLHTGVSLHPLHTGVDLTSHASAAIPANAIARRVHALYLPNNAAAAHQHC